MGARRSLAGLVVALAAVAAAPVRAQPPSGVVGEFVMGYSYHWYHRDMEPTVPVEKEWEVASLGVTYAATDWLSVGIHGGYWDVGYDDLPGTDYERYVGGASASARLYRHNRVDVVGEFRFSEVLDIDQSQNEFHKSARSVLVGVYAATRFHWRRAEVDVWAGPAFVRDVGKNYVFGAVDPLKDDSSDDVGAVAGTRVKLFDRVESSLWLVYAGYVQPRVGIGVRL